MEIVIGADGSCDLAQWRAELNLVIWGSGDLVIDRMI